MFLNIVYTRRKYVEFLPPSEMFRPARRQTSEEPTNKIFLLHTFRYKRYLNNPHH